MQDCLAPLGIQFGRLLLEEVVDLWVAAIGIGTALDDEGGETVAALPKAPLAPWIMFLSFLLPYASKKAARSSGRSLARMPAARRLSTTVSPRFAQDASQ